MTTSNHPENLKTNEAHDLGQISIERLYNFTTALKNRAEQDHDKHPQNHSLQAHFRGRKIAYETILQVLEEETAQQKAQKQYVVVEYPGTDRELQVFTAKTYRDCHLWMNRHYTDDHCPADIMVQLPDGTLSTEL